jgi:hypothetical protein
MQQAVVVAVMVVPADTLTSLVFAHMDEGKESICEVL